MADPVRESAATHPVPCQDCGSMEWPDWTVLPHEVFNAACPAGVGYLCLECFSRRVLAAAGYVVMRLPEPDVREFTDGAVTGWGWPAGDGVEVVRIGASLKVWDLDNWRPLKPDEARARAGALLAAADAADAIVRATSPAEPTEVDRG